MTFAREQLAKPRERRLTLGVAAFSTAQAGAIARSAGEAAGETRRRRGLLRRRRPGALLRQEPGERAGGRTRCHVHQRRLRTRRRWPRLDELRPTQRRGGRTATQCADHPGPAALRGLHEPEGDGPRRRAVLVARGPVAAGVPPLRRVRIGRGPGRRPGDVAGGGLDIRGRGGRVAAVARDSRSSAVWGRRSRGSISPWSTRTTRDGIGSACSATAPRMPARDRPATATASGQRSSARSAGGLARCWSPDWWHDPAAGSPGWSKRSRRTNRLMSRRRSVSMSRLPPVITGPKTGPALPALPPYELARLEGVPEAGRSGRDPRRTTRGMGRRGRPRRGACARGGGRAADRRRDGSEATRGPGEGGDRTGRRRGGGRRTARPRRGAFLWPGGWSVPSRGTAGTLPSGSRRMEIVAPEELAAAVESCRRRCARRPRRGSGRGNLPIAWIPEDDRGDERSSRASSSPNYRFGPPGRRERASPGPRRSPTPVAADAGPMRTHPSP